MSFTVISQCFVIIFWFVPLLLEIQNHISRYVHQLRVSTFLGLIHKEIRNLETYLSEGVELVATSIINDPLTRGTCKSHIRNGAFCFRFFFYHFEEETSKTYTNLNFITIVPFSFLCDLQVPLVLTPLWFYT